MLKKQIQHYGLLGKDKKTEGHLCAFTYCTTNIVHSADFPVFEYKEPQNFQRKRQQGWSGIQNDFCATTVHTRKEIAMKKWTKPQYAPIKISSSKFKTKGTKGKENLSYLPCI